MMDIVHLAWTLSSSAYSAYNGVELLPLIAALYVYLWRSHGLLPRQFVAKTQRWFMISVAELGPCCSTAVAPGLRQLATAYGNRLGAP